MLTGSTARSGSARPVSHVPPSSARALDWRRTPPASKAKQVVWSARAKMLRGAELTGAGAQLWAAMVGIAGRGTSTVDSVPWQATSHVGVRCSQRIGMITMDMTAVSTNSRNTDSSRWPTATRVGLRGRSPVACRACSRCCTDNAGLLAWASRQVSHGCRRWCRAVRPRHSGRKTVPPRHSHLAGSGNGGWVVPPDVRVAIRVASPATRASALNGPAHVVRPVQ